MKILACVSLGQGQTIQQWDLEGNHLIIRRFDSGAIALPLEESKIRLAAIPEEIVGKYEGAALSKEHLEAVHDSFDRVYLGALSIADAVLLRQTDSN